MLVSIWATWIKAVFLKILIWKEKLKVNLAAVEKPFQNHWSNLSSITVVFSRYFLKVSREWSEEPSIFSKLQVYENIHEVFSFSITWKANFCNNVQIFSLVESFFIELELYCPEIAKKNCRKLDFWVFLEQILFKSVIKPSQTSKINVIVKIVNILTICSEFFSALIHNSCSKGIHSVFTLVKKCNTDTKFIHFSIILFIANNNWSQALWD